MAPYFLRNLVPRREQRAEGRPLLEVLATLTWVQWGHFWSGYVVLGSRRVAPPCPDLSLHALGIVHMRPQPQLARMDLRRHRLLLRLAQRRPLADAVRPEHS